MIRIGSIVIRVDDLQRQLDLYSEQQTHDVERLLRLGASRVKWHERTADADYLLLAAPEGNCFGVVDAAGR